MLKIVWKIKFYFYVKFMIRFSCVSIEEQVWKAANELKSMAQC